MTQRERNKQLKIKKELENALNEIGWSIKGRNPYNYICDYEGKKTNCIVRDDRVEVAYMEKSSCCFYFLGVKVYKLTGKDGKVDCIGLQAKNNPSVFLQFYNHS